MELLFLGTVAGTPSKERNVSSLALKMYEERGSYWMFDCGEGTQHQAMRAHLKLGKLEKLFITHLHGDHLFGLPGLLLSRSYQTNDNPLDVYGPPGIRKYIEMSLSIGAAHLDYDLHIHEIEEGLVAEDEQFRIYCRKIEHRIDSYGYRLEEKTKPGRLLVEKLQAEGVPAGPHYARLKSGQDVSFDGRLLQASDYVEADIPGKIIVILGDTRTCTASMELARDADVLVHEATFLHEHADLAYKYYHATARQAAEIASQASVKRLILNHISSRYMGERWKELEAEAREVHSLTEVAHDFSEFIID